MLFACQDADVFREVSGWFWQLALASSIAHNTTYSNIAAIDMKTEEPLANIFQVGHHHIRP